MSLLRDEPVLSPLRVLPPLIFTAALCCYRARVCVRACLCVCVRVLTELCPALCDPVDCSLPGSSVHGSFMLVPIYSHSVDKAQRS